ncbi:MAG: FHA domain-containing protein [Acidobacteriota bacterium]|nr:FHA domain-containing protein [Acidobacteriota bacterium]
METRAQTHNRPLPPLRVTIGANTEGRRDLQFTKPFRIGRVEDCEVCIKDEHVSRAHAEVIIENSQWLVRDLGSSNGIFVDGERTNFVAIDRARTVRLGVLGPSVSFEVEQAAAPLAPRAPQPASEAMVGQNVDRYFAKPESGETVGDHTRMVRQAFARVQTKQKRKYGGIMAMLAIAVVAAGAYAFYLHQQVRKQKAMAQDLFYAMKSLDLDIASVEKSVLDSNSRQGREAVQNYQTRRRQMEKSYDQFLSTLHVYDSRLSEQDRLILRVARIFGECELAAPPEFMTEINAYIKKWQSSGRLARAIRTAQEKGYTRQISDELLAQDLPPQFFYLALQESGFDPYISGPMTRKGIAKGMWQFIPETAVKYGLHVGPLVDFRRPDPADDRHHYDRLTKAAARYLKDLYSTDAQASGLLVMSCYNWGESRVLPLVQSMPANPRERNFWRLLAGYREKVPQETYDYVFYIVSAAVIGENPRLFGFDFDNPLGRLESR